MKGLSPSLLSLFNGSGMDAKRSAPLTVPSNQLLPLPGSAWARCNLAVVASLIMPRARDLHLVLQSIDDRRLALVHRFPSGLCKVGGIILLGLPDLGVIKLGTVEEVRLRRTGLEARHGDAATLDLLVESGRKTVGERF